MLTSPLGWFEVSHLPPNYIEQVSKLAAIWKEHRDAIYSGHTIPIGEAPTGASWTGFLAGDPEGTAYALIFREQNDRAETTFPTGLLRKTKYTVTLLAGEGSIEFAKGRFTRGSISPTLLLRETLAVASKTVRLWAPVGQTFFNVFHLRRNCKLVILSEAKDLQFESRTRSRDPSLRSG